MLSVAFQVVLFDALLQVLPFMIDSAVTVLALASALLAAIVTRRPVQAEGDGRAGWQGIHENVTAMVLATGVAAALYLMLSYNRACNGNSAPMQRRSILSPLGRL